MSRTIKRQVLFATKTFFFFLRIDEKKFTDYDTAKIGITGYAAESLGDITFVELPDLSEPIEAGKVMSAIESVKAAAEIIVPISGTVIKVNEELESTPAIIQRDPEGEGWVAELELSDPKELEGLMTGEEYVKFLEEVGSKGEDKL
jgi:glycine cleavage system H protein